MSFIPNLINSAKGIMNPYGWKIGIFKGKRKGINLAYNPTGGGSDSEKKNLNNSIFGTTVDRSAKDIDRWRSAIIQSQLPYYPFRTIMQELFLDTILNEMVRACMLRRNNLTMLREFQISDANGNNIEEWTEYFKNPWFSQRVLPYMLDAKYYGYSLISLGDIKDGMFINPALIKRTLISPDRMQVLPFKDCPDGINWNEAQYKNWHLWIPTISEDGISTCGFGLLYYVAKTELYLKANNAWNLDFVQVFGQPTRELQTNKTEEAELKRSEEALDNMGSRPWIITEKDAENLVIHNGSANGNGYKSYNDFEHRMSGYIAKIMLGHEDAISSVPSKLGASQLVNSGSTTNDGDAMTPVAKAMRDIQTEDANFIEPIVNFELIPKMRKLGIMLPEGCCFEFLNDAEDREIKALEASKNQKIATLALTMVQGGLKMDKEYFTKMTGVPCESIEIGDVANNQLGGSVNDKSEHLKTGEALKDKSKERTNSPKKTVK